MILVFNTNQINPNNNNFKNNIQINNNIQNQNISNNNNINNNLSNNDNIINNGGQINQINKNSNKDGQSNDKKEEEIKYFKCFKCSKKIELELKKDHLLCHKLEEEDERNASNLLGRDIILARSFPYQVVSVRNGNHFPSLFEHLVNHHEPNRNNNNRISSHMNFLNLLRPQAIGITIVNRHNFLGDMNNIEEENIISEFPQIKIEDLNKLDECNRVCAICLLAFKVGEKVTSLPCIHFFHNTCIKTWLENENKCPVCKIRID